MTCYPRIRDRRFQLEQGVVVPLPERVTWERSARSVNQAELAGLDPAKVTSFELSVENPIGGVYKGFQRRVCNLAASRRLFQSQPFIKRAGNHGVFCVQQNFLYDKSALRIHYLY